MKSVIIGLIVMSSLASCKLTYRNDIFGVSDIMKAKYTYWFTQKLDHTDPTSKTFFSQRYHVYDDYVKNGKPQAVFLYICGEWTCNGIGEKQFPFVAAEKFNAIILVLEHRYFGETQPFEDWRTENLKFLNIHQALDDIAYFIQTIKLEQKFNIYSYIPWIHLGGSYPGALSAWFRYKYPHLTIGGLASSAVVRAVADYYEYDSQVYFSALETSQECVDNIQAVNEKIEADLKDDPAAIKLIFDAQDLTDIEFLSMIADIYAGMVQGRKRSEMCQKLSGGELQDWFNAVVAMAKDTVDQESYGSEFLKNTTIDSSKNSRQWTYQTCIEVGYFQTANPIAEQSTRSQQLKIDFFKNLCSYSYDADLFPDEERTNSYYGGLDIDIDHLIFSNGSDDPWQHASITTQKSGKQYTVKFIKCTDCSHCVDLKAASVNDPAELTQARQDILNIFEQWIIEHYNNLDKSTLEE